MKLSSVALAGIIGVFGLFSLGASAATPVAVPGLKTIAAVYQGKTALAGKTISAQGKVVKVNNGIMGRNFVHVQDGTGEASKHNNNLVVTSKQTAKVGDQVTISGLVVLDRDFGSGYSYPLLIEEASITPKK